MKDVADTHLQCRNGTWYYRRAVPKHLVQAMGKSMIFHSLHTTEKKKAKKLREIEDVKWSAQFAAFEAGEAQPASDVAKVAIGEQELLELVRAYVERNSRQFDERETAIPATSAERKDAVENTERDISILRDPDDLRADEWIGAIGGKLLAEAGQEPKSMSSTNDARFAEVVRRGLLELSRRKLAHYQDDFGKGFFDAEFDPARPKPLRFEELANQYLLMQIEEAEANGMSAKWQDKIKAQVTLVRELIGDDTPVSAIDYDLCLRARSLLARTPSNRTKIYPGLSLEAAIKKAAEEGRPLMAPVTQATYLDTLRGILRLAELKRLLPHNPASTLRPLKRDAEKPEDKREPFKLEQIKAFFTGTFYQSCAPNAPVPYAKADREWRFWLPLLCLFTGARPNELCQMPPDDVKCSANGTWFLDLVVAADDDDDASAGQPTKTLKNATSRRKIPIHPELLALGFVEFAKAKQKAKAERLFSGLKKDKYGNWASYSLKRFRDTFLPEAITVGPKQAFYSFRHTFRDALRRSKAGPDTLKALGGWSQGSVTSDNYGDKSDPDLHVEAMAKVSYPGLDLSYLRPANEVTE
ncbi:MAG: site-specific integrase [Mesorhizobium sp.]|nr:MAG: site-specific integrase [Mesorhizobium sp.]TIQ54353.1 MAG: site-specific integrase [Mesorhizobium sp.]